MPDTIGNLEKMLLDTRERIRTKRREITGGVIEDKVKELGKKTYTELDQDLDTLQKVVIEGKEKATGTSLKVYEELESDISAARTKLHNKRMEITGGVAEEKAKDAAKTIKHMGEAALKEIEEDIGRISEKVKNQLKSE